MTAAGIVVEGLSKQYRRVRRAPGWRGQLAALLRPQVEWVRAIEDLNFQVPPGSRMAYLGPNGAGKSTTLKILSGVMRPSSGRVTVNGRVPYAQRIAHAQHIGVVFGQRSQLWWDLPVADSFAILRQIYQVPRPVFEKNLQRFRSLLAMDEIERVPVRQLSLGQRMRAEIAAAFVHDPQVVFLDEPTMGLDARLKQAIRSFIRAVHAEQGCSVLLTSHDMDDVQAVCDQVILIDRARLAYQGPLAGLGQQTLPRSVSFSYRPSAAAPAALADLAQLPGVCALESALESEDARLRLHYRPQALGLAALTAHLFRHFEITDFSVQEPDLDAVLRALYAKP